MTIYNSWNYRAILAEQSRILKGQRPGFTLQRLAQKTNLQAPYLTNVLKERAHLSHDQAYVVANEMGFSPEERDHLLLLIEWERSGLKQRQTELKTKIEAQRREKLKSKAVLQKENLEPTSSDETRFFLNPYYTILNAFMAVERLSQSPSEIAQALHVSPIQIELWLKDLEQMGFLNRTKTGYQKLKRNFHLSKESPLCQPHQNLMSQISARHMQSLPESEKFNFNLIFSADEDTRDQIQAEYLKFLKAIEGLVKKAPSQNIFGLSFDLFRWS